MIKVIKISLIVAMLVVIAAVVLKVIKKDNREECSC